MVVTLLVRVVVLVIHVLRDIIRAPEDKDSGAEKQEAVLRIHVQAVAVLADLADKAKAGMPVKAVLEDRLA
jgi:hypothetical protein